MLTPYIHKSYMAGPWNEEAEAMVVKTLDRAVSIVGFLNPVSQSLRHHPSAVLCLTMQSAIYLLSSIIWCKSLQH